MRALDRDRRILTHIISYCDQIDMAVARFGNDMAVFTSDPVYRNAVSLYSPDRRTGGEPV